MRLYELHADASRLAWLHDDPAIVARFASDWDRREDLGDSPVADTTVEEVAKVQAKLLALLGTDNTLTVYRGMHMDNLSVERLEPGDALGQSWSLAARHAVPYNSNARRATLYRFQAVVTADQVDWLTTIILHENGEDEIRIKDRGQVRLVSIRPVYGQSDGETARPDLTGEIFRTAGRV